MAETVKTFSLQDLMDEYDKMSDEGAFEGADHPIVKLAGHVDLLRAELAECKKDAERYRWLMDNTDWFDQNYVLQIDIDKPETISSAIDAMKAKGE